MFKPEMISGIGTHNDNCNGQGSLVAKKDKKHLTLVCGLIAIWQLAALYIGNVLAGLLYINDLARNERFIGTVIRQKRIKPRFSSLCSFTRSFLLLLQSV